MSRSSLTTSSGRWLPRNIRIMGIKLVALVNAFRGFVDQFGTRHGKRSEKLRGPILWLGDMHKRNDGNQGTGRAVDGFTRHSVISVLCNSRINTPGERSNQQPDPVCSEGPTPLGGQYWL
jgi:hypothetical protein